MSVRVPGNSLQRLGCIATETRRRCTCPMPAPTFTPACSIDDLPDQLLGHIFVLAGLKGLQ